MVTNPKYQSFYISCNFMEIWEKTLSLLDTDPEYLRAIANKITQGGRQDKRYLVNPKNKQINSKIRFLCAKYVKEKEAEEIGQTESNSNQESSSQ